LLEELEYKEWVVTVTFYSGVHCAEASFAQDSKIQHSETSMPHGYKGSIHSWREDLVHNYFPSAFNAFRKLRNSSIIARYLSHSSIPSLSTPVEDFFSDEDVNNFINRDLDKIKRKLGIIS